MMKYFIYFLIRNEKVVYVGQTKSVKSRVASHRKDKNFDTYRAIECPIGKLNYYEIRWILRFNPKYNKMSTCTLSRKDGPIKQKIMVSFYPDVLKKFDELAKKHNRKRKNFMENLILSHVLNEELKRDSK